MKLEILTLYKLCNLFFVIMLVALLVGKVLSKMSSFSIRNHDLLRLAQVVFVLAIASPLVVPFFPKWISLPTPKLPVTLQITNGESVPRIDSPSFRVSSSGPIGELSRGNNWDFSEKYFWLFAFLVSSAFGYYSAGCGLWKLRNFLNRCVRLKKIGRVHLLLSDESEIPFATRSFSKIYFVYLEHP